MTRMTTTTPATTPGTTTGTAATAATPAHAANPANPATHTPARSSMTDTESPSAQHTDLDLYPAEQLVDALVDDQLNAVNAVRGASADLAGAVRAAVPRIAAGGRLVYVGAGTSGRLGMQDAVELYPTFSWPRDRAIALLAGGPRAVTEAIEEIGRAHV